MLRIELLPNLHRAGRTFPCTLNVFAERVIIARSIVGVAVVARGMMTMEEKFKAAVNVIRSLPKHGSYQPSTDMQLKFYSFYKQATEGPCTSPKPSFWDVVGKAKWDAWKNLGNMNREEAMEKYVDELKQIIETMSYTENVAKFIDMLGPFYEVIPLEKAAFNGDMENDGEEKDIPAIKGRRINGYGQRNEVDSDGDEFSDTYDQVSEENGLSNGQATNNPSHLLVQDNPSKIWDLYPDNETDEMITQARGGGGTDISGSGLNPTRTNNSAGTGRSVRQRSTRDSTGTSTADSGANPGVSGGAGGGEEGRRSSKSDVTIEEQLALAVIKLQHTMDQVNSRLETLESTMKTFRSDKNKVKGIEFLLGISPRLLILILVWPFVAHWLLHVCRRK